MSESGVKKLLNADDISLVRLSAVCEVLGLTLSEFFELIDGARRNILEFSPEQEQCILRDTSVLRVFFRLAHQNWSVAEIMRRDGLARNVVYKAIRALEEVGLLRWLPDDRIELACGPFPLLTGSEHFRTTIKQTLISMTIESAMAPGNRASLRFRYFRTSRAALQRFERMLDDALEATDVHTARDSKLLASEELEELCVAAILLPGSPWG